MARITRTITHPETGETFTGSAIVYRDGVVIAEVVRYNAPGAADGHCRTCNCSEVRVDGGSFRGSIRRIGRRWAIRPTAGPAFPVTFRTRREAMVDTITLALDDRDLRASGWSDR
jgi:hypothetical protein